MRVAMLVASEEATSGSVIANADRISARSKGSSHSAFWASLPNWSSTSMLPVSGAAQFRAAGASWIARPVISASGAYWRLVSPAPAGPGMNAFHSPRSRASARSDWRTGTRLQAHGSSSSVISRANTASAGCTRVSMRSRSDSRSSSVRASQPKSISPAFRSRPAASDSSPIATRGSTIAPIPANPSPRVCPCTCR